MSRAGMNSRKRKQHQDGEPITPLQAIVFGSVAALLIYIVLAYTGCWWPFSLTERCGPPPDTKLIMFLIDVSEGITRKEPRPLTEIIHSVTASAKPGDAIIVSQITDDPKAPTQKITQFKTPETKPHLDKHCKVSHGKLPDCDTLEHEWPIRFTKDNTTCGKKSILKACSAGDEIREDIEKKIVFPTGRPLTISPIAESLESAEEILAHNEKNPENRAIHIYSDMVQNTPCWWSMIDGQKGYVNFEDWSNRALLRTKRQGAAKCIGRPIPIRTKKIIAYLVPRPEYLPSQRHVLKLQNFWENFLRRSTVEWLDVEEKQSGTPGSPK